MDTSQQITIGQAFAHCFSTSSYWIWMGVIWAGCLGIILVLRHIAKTQEVNRYIIIVANFLIAAAIIGSILTRPLSVKQNTSTDAARRGNFLGY